MLEELTEIWKPVPFKIFCKHYSVSNFGRVRRETGITNTYPGKILAICPQKGYAFVNLKAEKHHKRASIHQLVALAFLGIPPGPIGNKINDYQADHINGDKFNNHVENLQWIIHKDHKRLTGERGQMASGDRNGARLHPETRARGAQHGNAVLTTEEVASIRALSIQGLSQRALARQFHTTQTTVRRIIKYRTRVTS